MLRTGNDEEKANYVQNNGLKKARSFIIQFKEFNLKLIFKKYKANNICRNIFLQEVELNPLHPSISARFSAWLPKTRMQKGRKIVASEWRNLTNTPHLTQVVKVNTTSGKSYGHNALLYEVMRRAIQLCGSPSPNP